MTVEVPRYVVIESTPGYLADDDDPGTFVTLRDARAYARELVQRLREYHAEDEEQCTVSVDSRTAPRCWYVVTARQHDLGRIVEIVTIAEEDRALYAEEGGF